jgi:hypothetical protein
MTGADFVAGTLALGFLFAMAALLQAHADGSRRKVAPSAAISRPSGAA